MGRYLIFNIINDYLRGPLFIIINGIKILNTFYLDDHIMSNIDIILLIHFIININKLN